MSRILPGQSFYRSSHSQSAEWLVLAKLKFSVGQYTFCIGGVHFVWACYADHGMYIEMSLHAWLYGGCIGNGCHTGMGASNSSQNKSLFMRCSINSSWGVMHAGAVSGHRLAWNVFGVHISGAYKCRQIILGKCISFISGIITKFGQTGAFYPFWGQVGHGRLSGNGCLIIRDRVA